MRNIAKRSVALLLLVAVVLSVCQGVVVPTFAGVVWVLFARLFCTCYGPIEHDFPLLFPLYPQYRAIQGVK